MKKRDVMRDSRPRELLLAAGVGTGKGGGLQENRDVTRS
jgi:hypothetical protein